MNDFSTGKIPFECRRCGTCCRKGGPGLHHADLDLVAEKRIPAKDLYTIRMGELVRDNINGGLIYTDTEIIKIREAPQATACSFFIGPENVCGIYDKRPSQCRAMHCRDTAEIVGMHVKNRMCRKDLFGGVDWLWEIIEAHEQNCSYVKIRRIMEQRRAGDTAASHRLAQSASYDQAVRELAVEKAGMEKEMLDLVFGLPLAFVLQNRFGITIHRKSPP